MAITHREGLPTRGQEALMTWAVILLPVTWVICLARSGAYAPRYIGTGPGPDEYRTVSQAVVLLAVAAVLSYAFKLEVSRGFVGLVLPAGAAPHFPQPLRPAHSALPSARSWGDASKDGRRRPGRLGG